MAGPLLLVHGAWHGAWCWDAVVGRLQLAGRQAIAPTLPGCAERADELSPKIGLETYITDLGELLETQDLTDVVLVGHSAAGAIVPAVAARNAARISHLVCLDSHMPQEGEALFDVMAPEAAESRRAAAAAHDGGVSVPAPDPEALGVFDKVDAAFVTRMMTPHPIRAFSESGSPRNNSQASARLLPERTSQSSPFTPGRTTSRLPGTSDAISGRPIAAASSKDRGRPSRYEGSTTASAPARYGRMSSAAPRYSITPSACQAASSSAEIAVRLAAPAKPRS